MNRLYELYKYGGIREVYRGVCDFIRYDIIDAGESPYHERRNDNEIRWRIIRENLDDEFRTLLDVGCADGYLTAKAGEYGLKATGIDIDESRIEYAKDKWGAIDTVSFLNDQIIPETIQDLPTTDVCLFLTVHHHWVSEFGYDDSIDMFDILLQKNDVIFYEPPGDRQLPSTEASHDPADSIAHYTDLIENEFGDDIEIEAVEMVPYGPTRRSDPFFTLNARNY